MKKVAFIKKLACLVISLIFSHISLSQTCSNSTLTLPYSNTFEAGLDNWNSGGSDAIYANDATWSYSGSRSLQIQDNSGAGFWILFSKNLQQVHMTK